MKKHYTTPKLDSIRLEDKDTISMATNNIKTFNASSLSDSCGYDELFDLFGGSAANAADIIANIPLNEIPALLEGTGFDLVAS